MEGRQVVARILGKIFLAAEYPNTLNLKSKRPNLASSHHTIQKARFTFFSTIEITPRPSETEREKLANLFTTWIMESGDWWGGTWASHELADWNVNQHLRGRKLGVDQCGYSPRSWERVC